MMSMFRSEVTCDGCMKMTLKHQSIIIAFFFSSHLPQKAAYTGSMDSLSPLSPLSSLGSFHRNLGPIDNNTYMAPDFSHGLDDMRSFVSLSPNTLLQNALLSPGNFSHNFRGFSSSLSGSFHDPGTYTTSNIQDKYQRLQLELLKEKRDHINLRLVVYLHIL